MRSFRRLLGVAALVGAGFGIVGNTPSASAYCSSEMLEFDDGSGGGSNGCGNPCPDSPTFLDKYGLGWDCLQ